MGQTDPMFHCRHVEPPCGDYPFFKRDPGPGTSERQPRLIHN